MSVSRKRAISSQLESKQYRSIKLSAWRLVHQLYPKNNMDQLCFAWSRSAIVPFPSPHKKKRYFGTFFLAIFCPSSARQDQRQAPLFVFCYCCVSYDKKEPSCFPQWHLEVIRPSLGVPWLNAATSYRYDDCTTTVGHFISGCRTRLPIPGTGEAMSHVLRHAPFLGAKKSGQQQRFAVAKGRGT